MWRKGLEHLAEPYRTIVAELLRALKERLGEKLVSLVVFGSVARGDARPESDIDLFIVAEGLPKGRLKRTALFCEIEDELEPLLERVREEHGIAAFLSALLKTPQEAQRLRPLYLDMVEDAVIIYDRNGFFESVLARLKKRLEELGARRVWVGKKWYWILKPDAKFGEVMRLNSYRMAISYLRQARERLVHAGEALESGNYAYVVRQSQEAVELALKAALRLMDIEPPRWHDVGPVLKQNAERFPPSFRAHIGKLAFISRQLAHEREFSMCGDEELGLPPDDLYGQEDATWALEQARFVIKLIEELLGEVRP